MPEQVKQDKKTIKLPDFCLVLLVGCAGAGKSSFARQHFSKTEIISSDYCRALVCDDEQNQAASADAFALLHYLAALRLKNRRFTVIDATNLRQSERQKLRMLAKDYHAATVVIVINPGFETCLKQNAERKERVVPENIITDHNKALVYALSQMPNEAFLDIFTLNGVTEIKNVEVVRAPLTVDKRYETGSFDLIGDIHGCFDELVLLLKKLGYSVEIAGSGNNKTFLVGCPAGRRVIFLGDLVDRGPNTPDVLALCKTMMDQGAALCVQGNHEVKLLRWLAGKKVNPKYGLAESVAQLSERSEAFKQEMFSFMKSLPSHLWLDNGNLLVAHAGLKQDMHGRMSGKEKSFCLYGDTTGEKDEFGWPIRLNWGADYTGEAMVVYGHTPVATPQWQNNTLCIDTGCAFGGKLTALRYPEKQLVSVDALAAYMKPKKPLGSILDEGQG